MDRRQLELDQRLASVELVEDRITTWVQDQFATQLNRVAQLSSRVDYIQALPMVTGGQTGGLSQEQIEGLNGLVAKLTAQEDLTRTLQSHVSKLSSRGKEWKGSCDDAVQKTNVEIQQLRGQLGAVVQGLRLELADVKMQIRHPEQDWKV